MEHRVKKKKKHNRSLLYRISAWLHLWLGLVTGIIVVIVCLTGCIWVFNEEITKYILEPDTRVAYKNEPVLSPSRIREVAQQHYPGKLLSYASYRQGSPIELFLNESGRRKRGGGGVSLKIDPYTGAMIRTELHQKGEIDFFRFILNGHRFLWLPWKIGRPVVNYSILIFVITLITGLVLWWPKKWNKSTRDASFKVKWNAKFKRLNYDLHNVLGFYSLLLLTVIALTGMVYGIEWFSKGTYWLSSGGRQSLPEDKGLFSDSTQAGKHYTAIQALDIAWHKVITKHPDAKGFYYSFPDTTDAKSTIGIFIYPSTYSSYRSSAHFFDRHTAEALPARSVYAQDFATATFATKLRKMNYDLHVGSILGFPGKVLAFFGALIGATLPVTGFLVWWGKKKKSKKPVARGAKAQSVSKREAVLVE